jgi:hypothetical protein
MGLYDDDLETARSAEGYQGAGRLALELKGSSTVPTLSAAVEALEQLAAEYPVLLDSDGAFKEWRSLAVQVGRELRGGAAPGWESFAEAHPSFVHLLDDRDGMTRFETSGRFGYQLWHPDSWRTRVSDTEAQFITSPESDFKAFFSVLVEDLPFQPTLESFAAYALERLRRDLVGSNILDRGFRRLDRADAYQIDYVSPQVRGRMILAIHGNAAITLTCQSAPEGFAVLEPGAAEIIASFQLKG